MTFANPAGLHTNATALGHGLENARQIMRDPKVMHPDQIVMEACSFLMVHGDPLDYVEAEKVQQAVMSDLWRRRRDQQDDDDATSGLFLLAIAVMGCAAYAIFGWPL